MVGGLRLVLQSPRRPMFDKRGKMKKRQPMRDYNGDILNTGDLVWLTNRVPMELALVIGESHRENVLVRHIKGGIDFTVSDIDCEKVKKSEKKL